MQTRKKRAKAKRQGRSRAESELRLIGGFKLKDAASYLNLSQFTVMRLVQRGLLRANRATRHYLFSRAELDRFLAEGMVE
jgi:excisionase family DNA binding protein